MGVVFLREKARGGGGGVGVGHPTPPSQPTRAGDHPATAAEPLSDSPSRHHLPRPHGGSDLRRGLRRQICRPAAAPLPLPLPPLRPRGQRERLDGLAANSHNAQRARASHPPAPPPVSPAPRPSRRPLRAPSQNRRPRFTPRGSLATAAPRWPLASLAAWLAVPRSARLASRRRGLWAPPAAAGCHAGPRPGY